MQELPAGIIVQKMGEFRVRHVGLAGYIGERGADVVILASPREALGRLRPDRPEERRVGGGDDAQRLQPACAGGLHVEAVAAVAAKEREDSELIASRVDPELVTKAVRDLCVDCHLALQALPVADVIDSLLELAGEARRDAANRDPAPRELGCEQEVVEGAGGVRRLIDAHFQVVPADATRLPAEGIGLFDEGKGGPVNAPESPKVIRVGL